LFQTNHSTSAPVRFGVFELDVRAGDLRKGGRKVKLEGQPLQILTLLLERPGELVTREELKRALWSADTFVDFELSINAAVKRLRQALDDSADTPRYVETLPRRGYRFIYPITETRAAGVGAQSSLPKPKPRRVAIIATLAVLLAAMLAMLVAARRRPLGPRPAESIRSIAVLPLENLTGDPQEEAFVDGLHDELITQLAQIGSISVTSRTSVMRYRKQNTPLPEIADDLGVDGIIEGAVRRNGDHFYLTVQLIAGRSDRHIWAQSYDRALPAMAGLPSEVVRNVAGTLRVNLTPQEQAHLQRQGDVDPEVFRNYIKGKYYAGNWRPDDIRTALAFYQRALDIDPTFAPAWVEIGRCYSEHLPREGLSAEESYARAKAAARKAVELDETLWSAHHVLGAIAMLELDWGTAEKEMHRARELNPAWPGPSRYLLVTGHPDEAVAAAEVDARNDPLSYSANVTLGWTYFMAGRHDQAIVSLLKTVQLNPANHLAHYELGWNYAKKGMFKEAVAECETAISLMKEKEAAPAGCGWVFALAGQRERALQMARSLEGRRGMNAIGAGVAHIYDALGDRERAIRILQQRSKQERRALPLTLLVSPMFSPEIRKDHRFQELIRHMGYPQYRTMVAHASGK
jgi:TolB-like protein/DNA-binding winged helix-turn-helix (wHTH) protein/tetratricopeptide (TPR) repeat protein